METHRFHFVRFLLQKNTMYFYVGLEDTSAFGEKREVKISCESMDNLLGDRRITFIKMDIEEEQNWKLLKALRRL